MAENEQKPIFIQGDIYEVEKLVGTKIVNGKKLYRVRWQGYTAQSDTLEPEENLLSCKEMIKDLEDKATARLEKRRSKKSGAYKDFKDLKVPKDEKDGNGSYQFANEQSLQNSKDTFWKDFNEGKIKVSNQDMYSKVKERASRAGTHTEGKSSEVHQKEYTVPLCPKVLLKRKPSSKNSSAHPTYKSSLQVKSVRMYVKKRKKYDVLRDYRRRKSRGLKKRRGDENKQAINKVMPQNPSDNKFQAVKTWTNGGKPVVVSNEKCSENQNSSVLQELLVNDEICDGDFGDYSLSLVNTSSAKATVNESQGFHGLQSASLKKQEAFIISSNTFQTSKQNIENRINSVDVPKEHYHGIYQIANHAVPISSAQIKFSPVNYEGRSSPNKVTSKLDVALFQQVEIWRSLRLSNVLLEKTLKNYVNGNSEEKRSHVFDLLMAASVQSRLDIIDKLCSLGISANHVRSDGTTVLMIASQMGLHNAVKILLKHNAHKDKQNQYGETALMLACRHNRPKVVKLLLEHGANFSLTNVEGINALRVSNHYAKETEIPDILNGHISRMKLEFEQKVRDLMSQTAGIKYALFSIRCFSLNEGPCFRINFTHDVTLESPGKSGKGFLLFIAKSTIKGNCIRCTFHGDSPVSSVTLNGIKQDPVEVADRFVFKLPYLCSGDNKINIIASQYQQLEEKLVVCAYRVHYTVKTSSSCIEKVFIS